MTSSALDVEFDAPRTMIKPSLKRYMGGAVGR